MKRTRKISTVLMGLIVGVFALASLSPTLGHEGATGIVKQRMDLMKRYDELLDRVFAMVHDELPYSAKVVRKAAREIRETADDHLVRLFPDGSLQKPSKADPAIWQNMQFFEHMSERLEDFAEALEKNADKNLSGKSDFPKKWEDVPAMGAMMGQGGMMGRGNMMMGRGPASGYAGNAMEQSLWHVAHVCNTCHERFRKPE